MTLPLLLFNFATSGRNDVTGAISMIYILPGDRDPGADRASSVGAQRRRERLRTDMTQVAIRGLTKVYPGADAPSVDDLTLDIASGDLAALLGPSGCGKTTTMKMIAGLLPPTAGDVAFDGRSVLNEKPENRGVVMVFQNYLLFPYMSVADNIGFGLKMRKFPKDEIARRVGEMLELVRLPDLGARRPRELSGGQQQRVALARALIVKPKVLLLDEPLSNSMRTCASRCAT